MGLLTRATDWLLGENIQNTKRHRPKWFPSHDFDKRWLNERFAIFTLPPYKPPYKREFTLKAWVCMGPNYIISLNAIVDVDMDSRSVDVELYR